MGNGGGGERERRFNLKVQLRSLRDGQREGAPIHSEREQIINPSTELTMEAILDNYVVQLQQKVSLTYLNVAF